MAALWHCLTHITHIYMYNIIILLIVIVICATPWSEAWIDLDLQNFTTIFGQSSLGQSEKLLCALDFSNPPNSQLGSTTIECKNPKPHHWQLKDAEYPGSIYIYISTYEFINGYIYNNPIYIFEFEALPRLHPDFDVFWTAFCRARPAGSTITTGRIPPCPLNPKLGSPNRSPTLEDCVYIIYIYIHIYIIYIYIDT